MKNLLLLLIATILALLPTRSGAAPYALAVRSIQLNGYNLFIDSFNSTDPLRSTNEQYDPTKGGGDLAVVASDAGILNNNNVGNVLLMGRLETSLPYALEFGPLSSIGSVAWHQSGQTGIEMGYHTTNLSLVFPDVVMPFAGFFPIDGSYNGVYYNYLLAHGVYELPSLAMSGGQKLLVYGQADLVIRGNASLSGNSQIIVLPSARLRLFVGGAASLRGGGVINQGAPRNFSYLGASANSTLNLRVTTPFAGVIYAPNADCTISSSGNVPANVQGAIVTRTLNLGSHVEFHFDEGL